MASIIRQNYHEDCEAAVNKHINTELYASYVFMSLSYYFDRDDVALPGLKKFFQNLSDQEKENAEKMMKYQNQRGGRIVLQSIAAPSHQEWGQATNALKTALDLKKQVNKSLLDIRNIASEKNDSYTQHFLDDTYLDQNYENIQRLGEMLMQLRRVGEDLGLHIFDKDLA